MRQSFYSVASACTYLVLGVLFAGAAYVGKPVEFADAVVTPAKAWAVCGLMFLLAYFSLVHLRSKN